MLMPAPGRSTVSGKGQCTVTMVRGRPLGDWVVGALSGLSDYRKSRASGCDIGR